MFAALHGNGLSRVGATRAQLIDSDPDRCEALAAWGQVLHDCPAEVDGIVSRSNIVAIQHRSSLTREKETEIATIPTPLAGGCMCEAVRFVASQPLLGAV